MPIPQPYNLTQIGNFNTTLEFTQNVNTYLMDGWFGTLILITLFTMSFLSFIFMTKSASKSFIGSSWIAFIIALLLRAIELVPDIVFFASLTIAAISIAFIRQD